MTKLAVIRIKGKIGLKKPINETLNRLRLRKKYVCVILEKNKINEGMIKKVRDFVAFGEIKEETYKKLIEKRGKKDPNNKDKIKPFFRLHPPRGGIKTKLHFEEGGVLGNNKEKINNLIERML